MIKNDETSIALKNFFDNINSLTNYFLKQNSKCTFEIYLK